MLRYFCSLFFPILVVLSALNFLTFDICYAKCDDRPKDLTRHALPSVHSVSIIASATNRSQSLTDLKQLTLVKQEQCTHLLEDILSKIYDSTLLGAQTNPAFLVKQHALKTQIAVTPNAHLNFSINNFTKQTANTFHPSISLPYYLAVKSSKTQTVANTASLNLATAASKDNKEAAKVQATSSDDTNHQGHKDLEEESQTSKPTNVHDGDHTNDPKGKQDTTDTPLSKTKELPSSTEQNSQDNSTQSKEGNKTPNQENLAPQNDAKKTEKEKEKEKDKDKDKDADKKSKNDKQPKKSGSDKHSAGGKKKLPPLKMLLTSPFGERRLGGPTGFHFHGAIDLRAHLGWPVVAFASGVIRQAGFNGRAGIMVEIAHTDGTFSRYAHLQTATVREGQTVNKGDKIGEVGCTGHTTGAHLHFALYDTNHKAVDPMKYLTVAEDILRPDPSIIPDKVGPQQCNGYTPPYVPVMPNYRHLPKYGKRRGWLVIRSRSGRTIRVDLNSLRNYKPPEIPLWNSRKRMR